MRDGREIHMKRRIFYMGLVVICLVCRPHYAQEPRESSVEHVKAIIRTIIPALEALEAQLPRTGRGTATMETENYFDWLDGKELTMDFVFKNQNSRWDISEWIGKSNSSRLLARISSDKYNISLVHDDCVTINSSKGHNASQNDFHPTTFLRFNDYSLIKLLQGTLSYDFTADPEHYASAKLDDKGILHIVSGGPVRNSRVLSSEKQMSFDTKRGLLPVLLKGTTKEKERTDSAIVRLEWAQYDSSWYVSRVEYSIEPGNRKHRIFKIKKFRPNVDVSDEEFTLDGLNIPDGMMVLDRLAGVNYSYGVTVRLIEDLEKPLKEADFVQKIQEQQPVLVTQTTDANIQKGLSNQNQPAVDDGDSMPLSALGRTHGSRWLYVITIACVVILIGAVAFLGYRYVVTRS
jgi:hypothetical protein